MSLQITIEPEIGQSGNGMSTTSLKVIVNLASIMSLLSTYDLLLSTSITVKTETGEAYIYEYANVYRNVITSSIEFQTMVLGKVISLSQISGKAKGTFLKKISDNDSVGGI